MDLSELRTKALDISRIIDYLNFPEPFLFENGKPLDLHGENVPVEITLRNVSFRYPHSNKRILEHVDLTINPGERIALVGLNGAGKTTMTKLFAGLYDPSEGAVLLNGEDLRIFNRKDVYKQITAVFQDSSLLDATVLENITQLPTAVKVDMQKAREAYALSGLESRIDSLPNAENTLIGKSAFEDGVQLSGGEKQRLLLARALYKNSPIILLDEPTAALDPIAESKIYQEYAALTNNKTAVFISHRLASTRFCDRILFLENGHITEQGSHEELMAANGRYAKLFAVQSKYYKEGRERENLSE